MDVLIIGEYDPTNTQKGGTYTHIKSWCDFLLQNTNISIGIISNNVFYIREGRNLILKKKFHISTRLKNALLKNIFSYQKIYQNLLLEYKPKFLHVHGTSVLSKKILTLAKKLKISIFLSVHGIVAEERKYWPKLKKYIYGLVYGMRENIVLKNADWVVVDTLYVRKFLNKHYNFDKPNLTIIPLGIDEHWFQIKWEPIENRIITVGGIEVRKGFHYLVEASKLLKDDKIDFKVIICGRIRNQKYYYELTQKIKLYDLGEIINFKINVSDKELLDEYKKADLFVLPSLEESQGIVLVEAMAIGMPVVATDAGGIPYIIKNNRNGIIAKKGDHKAFYKALRKILLDSDLKQKIANNNKQDSIKYTAEYTNNQIFKIYKKFLR
jgi:glycosyltransferase involved in cell wall biosynthesis